MADQEDSNFFDVEQDIILDGHRMERLALERGFDSSLDDDELNFEGACQQIACLTWKGTFDKHEDGAIRLLRKFPGLARRMFPSTLIPGDVYGLGYPLLIAAITSSLHVVQVLYEAYPEAIEQNYCEGSLLHCVLCCSREIPIESPATKIEVVRFLIKRYPEAVRVVNDRSNSLPIHIAIHSPTLRFDIIRELLCEYPEGMFAEDCDSATPFNTAMLSDGSIQLIELFVDNIPSHIDLLEFGYFPDISDTECVDLCPSRASLFLEVLAKCQNCVIDLSSFWNSDAFALALLLGLRTNTCLQSIALKLPDTTCAQEDIQFALHRLLRKHTELRRFTITVSSTDQPGSIMPGDHNKLVNVVALAIAERTEPPLDHLCFSNFNIDSDEGSLETMMASDNIKDELMIDDCDMSASAMESLKRGLGRATSIRKLDLGVSTKIGDLDMTQMLRGTKSLTSVSLSVHSVDTVVGLETLDNIEELALYEVCDNAIDYTEILPRLLSNRNLRTLRILGGQFQMKTLAPLLRQNPQLKRIEVTCVDPEGNAGADEVLRLLKTENTSIEECILVFANFHNDDDSLSEVELYGNQDELNYYCLLNKAGRKDIRDPNATCETVINTIAALCSLEQRGLDLCSIRSINDDESDSLRYSILREVPHVWSSPVPCTSFSVPEQKFGLWNWVEQRVVANRLLDPITSIIASLGGPSRPKKRSRFN